MAFTDFLPMIGAIAPNPMEMAQMSKMAVPNMARASQANYMRMRMLHNMANPVGGRLSGFGRARGAPGVGGEPAMQPELMQNLDVEKINQQLAQFGVQLPTNPNPNAFLPNTGFFGNHPGFAAGLEGALLGAMGAGSADTWGEGISNAIRGGVGAIESRRAAVNAQYTAPLDMAHTLGQLTLNQAQLQNYTDMHQLHNAQMRNIDSEINARDNKPDPKLYGQPVPGGSGNWLMPNLTSGELTDTGEAVGAKPSSSKGSSMIERMVNAEEEQRVAGGGQPFTAEERNQKIVGYSTRMAGGKAAAAAAGSGNIPETGKEKRQRDFQTAEANMKNAHKDLEDFDKQKPSQLYAKYKAYSHDDPAVQAARAPLVDAAAKATQKFNSFSMDNEGAPAVNPKDPANLFGK